MSSEIILQRLTALHPRVIDLSLERIARLLAELGHPERHLPPVIHVAGTNGKGSVVAYLRAMLEAAGKTCHVYTSPHLVRFHERIRLAGREIGEDELAAVLQDCERVNAGQPITFFEIVTAAALLAFARHPADALLLEVGLGGVADATNVIDKPAACAITRIGIDHTQFLGDTIAAIAGEKAGIVKPGVPVVVGRQRPEAAAVIERVAREKGAPLHRLGVEWDFERTPTGFRFRDAAGTLDLPPPALLGAHQFDNAAMAVALLRLLPQFAVSAAAFGSGLHGVEWPARLQRLHRGPLVELLRPQDELWLDGGHNADCGTALAGQAVDWAARDGRPLHLIFGMLTSKHAQGFLQPLVPHAVDAHAVGIPGHDAYSAEEASARAQATGLRCTPAADIAAALADILGRAPGPVRVLICGSLYLAGTVLAQNG